MTRPLLLLTAFLLVSSSAYSHVEVRPKRAPAGSEARLTLEVENERPTSATRRIDVQVPAGVTSVTGLALRGWMLRLRPAEGAPRRMILTAPEGRELTGHEAGRFRLRVGLPSNAGRRITFKVLQTYDNGEIVRWIGPPGSEEPAPTLRLTAAEKPAPEEAPAGTDARPQNEPPSGQVSGEQDDDSIVGPIAVGIGAVVVLVASIALWRRRSARRNETST